IMWRWPWEKPIEPVKPPKVGGTRAPDQVIAIDFSRPHDFHFSFYSGSDNGTKQVFRRCILLGFTTPTDAGGNRVGGEGEWAQHDRWLVLRQPDGRLVYVPRGGLHYIEESQPAGDEATNA